MASSVLTKRYVERGVSSTNSTPSRSGRTWLKRGLDRSFAAAAASAGASRSSSAACKPEKKRPTASRRSRGAAGSTALASLSSEAAKARATVRRNIGHQAGGEASRRSLLNLSRPLPLHGHRTQIRQRLLLLAQPALEFLDVLAQHAQLGRQTRALELELLHRVQYLLEPHVRLRQSLVAKLQLAAQLGFHRR